MKYKISFCDDIELLVTADSEVEAVKKAKSVKDRLKVADKDWNEDFAKKHPSKKFSKHNF